MKRTYLDILVLCFIPCFTFGQYKEPISIPTPNATAISAIGEIPMSLFTGRANISIPIFEKEIRGVGLSVSLSYDTSGILLNALPSWTGHSWNLNAGGAITRNVKGYYDEGYAEYYHKYNTHTAWDNYFSRYSDISCTNDGDYMPDIFNFNFMGMSGKFWLGNDGEWKVASDNNLLVEFDINDSNNYIYGFSSKYPSGREQPKTIRGFTITDSNGNKYVFGGDSTSIESSISLFDDNNDNVSGAWYADTWYLKDVFDRYGNKLLSFEYEKGMFIITSAICLSEALPNFKINTTSYLKTIVARDGTKMELIRDSNCVLSSKDFYSKMYKQGVETLYRTLRDAQHGNNITKTFVYLLSDEYNEYQNPNKKENDPLSAMGLTPLKEIRLYSMENLYKKYKFEYNDLSKSRLHLKGIKIEDALGAKEGSYLFTYQNFDQLPLDYLSIQSDYWGYYNNGRVTNGFPDKNVNETTCKYGMLTSIMHPTGGVTSIDYSCNQYSGCRNTKHDGINWSEKLSLAGGLRVSKISNYKNSNFNVPLSSKTYEYFDGILSYAPIMQTEYTEHGNYYGWTIVKGINTPGTHIGYSTVIESDEYGEYDDQRSYIYRYSNYSDYKDEFCDPFLGSRSGFPYEEQDKFAAYEEWTSRDYRLGKLLSKTTCNHDDSEWERVTYVYRTDSLDMEKYYTIAYADKSDIKFTINPVRDALYSYKLFYPKYDIVCVKHETRMDKYNEGPWFVEFTEYQNRDTIYHVNRNNKVYKPYVRLLEKETLRRGSQSISTTYDYPTNNMLVNDFYIQPDSICKYAGNEYLYGTRTLFNECRGKMVPWLEMEYANPQKGKKVLEYDNYTSTFLPQKYCNAEGQNVFLQWNSYDQILSINKEQLTTTCTYNKYGFVETIEQPNGYTLRYQYDSCGRLAAIIDQSGNIIKQYEYRFWSGE